MGARHKAVEGGNGASAINSILQGGEAHKKNVSDGRSAAVGPKVEGVDPAVQKQDALNAVQTICNELGHTCTPEAEKKLGQNICCPFTDVNNRTDGGKQ